MQELSPSNTNDNTAKGTSQREALNLGLLNLSIIPLPLNGMVDDCRQRISKGLNLSPRGDSLERDLPRLQTQLPSGDFVLDIVGYLHP